MLIHDAAADDPARREITVLADKSLPYELVKRVMSTCTREGYGKISLAVLEKETLPPRVTEWSCRLSRKTPS